MIYSKENGINSIGQPILSGPTPLIFSGYEECMMVGNPGLSIDQQARALYVELFSRLVSEYKLVRAWNYVPSINTMVSPGRDIYMEFNSDRFLAWQEAGPRDDDGRPLCPAMTAIGAVSGPLMVHALMSKNPVYYLGNKRQRKFIDYSDEFGTHPPCSSRITVEDCGDHFKLWVAGTASVVGQQTEGRTLEEQMTITWRNLDALLTNNLDLAQIGVPMFDTRTPRYVRAYLRDPNRLSTYKVGLSEYFCIEPTIHLADICRGVHTGILYHEVECMYQVLK